jgi:hypothetical protein
MCNILQGVWTGHSTLQLFDKSREKHIYLQHQDTANIHVLRTPVVHPICKQFRQHPVCNGYQL